MRFLLAALAAFFVIAVGASGASQAVDLNALYQAASPGDTVVVPAGSYGTQSIARDPDKAEGSAPVVFVAAPGADVSFTTVELGTNRTLGPLSLELRDMSIGVTRIVNAKDVTLRDNDLGIVIVSAAERLRWIGGDVGPWSDGVVNLFGSCTGGPTACLTTDPSRDILIDGVEFHDFTVSDPANHSECLQLGGVGGRNENVTIRNSTFRNCTDFDLLVQGSLLNITIENNMLDAPMPGDRNTTACSPDCPRAGNAIRVDDRGGYDGIRIRYNTSLGGISVDPGSGSVLVRGNIGTRSAGGFFCSSQPGTQDHNVWATNSCSPTDVSVASLAGVVVDADGRDGTLDLHLRDGSVAIDAGDPADFPPADFDGDARPAGSAPDIGADEHGATAPPPPPPPLAKCEDGIDNDSDGHVDFPNDPGCTSGADDDETDPPPPPPACPGTTLPLTVVEQDATTIAFGWSPVDGAIGYRFNSTELGDKWPHTWDPNRSTVRFAKGSDCYRVQALGVIADGGIAG